MMRRWGACLLCLLLCLSSPPSAMAEGTDRLTVMVYDRGNMPSEYGTPVNNAWTEYIQQAVLRDCNIEVEYYAVPRSNDVDQLEVLLAANAAPDIVFTYDVATWQNYCVLGNVADLTDSLREYGGAILANCAEVLPYGQYRGRQMVIPATRVLREVTSGFMRKDWLDALGIPISRNEEGNYAVTTEELYEILAAFKQANLGGVDPEQVWGMMSYGTTHWPVLLILEAFYNQQAATDEVRAAYPAFLYPGAKEGYRYLNRLYNDGLLNRDFAVIGDSDRSTYCEYIIDGHVGFWINDAWFGVENDSTLAELYAREPQAEVIAVDILHASGRPSYKQIYSPAGMFIFVPSLSGHVDSAVKYLNWLADIDNHNTLIYGFEGEHYEWVDGIPTPIDIEYNLNTRISMKDLGIMYNGSPDEETYFAYTLLALPEEQREMRRAANQVAMSNTFSEHLFTEPIEEETYYNQTLQAKEQELRIRTIMCSADAFDMTWDRMVAEYMDAGGQAVIEARLLAYRQDRAEDGSVSHSLD